MNNLTAKLPKIILIVLALGVLIEVGLSVKTLMTSVPVSKVAKVNFIREGVLLLLAKKAEYKVGEIVPVLVRIDSGGHSVEGVDTFINFDNKRLLASSSAVIRGRAFGEFPQIEVDQKKGTIRISGVSGVKGTSFSGLAELATINFKAVATGDVTTSLDFISKGSTADSNIIEAGTSNDILGRVVNLKVTIK